jgi:hypothetical protein
MRGLAYLPLLLSVGCSFPASTPTEEDAKSFFVENLVGDRGDSAVQLLSFKKTDGQWGVKDGVKFYRLAYAAEFRYAPPALGQVEPNSVRTHTGWIRFSKTEKGWDAQFDGGDREISAMRMRRPILPGGHDPDQAAQNAVDTLDKVNSDFSAQRKTVEDYQDRKSSHAATPGTPGAKPETGKTGSP